MSKRVRIALVLLVCAALVAGCGTVPWPGKGVSATPAAPGAVEAQSLAAAGALAYVRQGDVWLQPAEGGDPARVTTGGRAWDPSLSPDGATLVYVQAPVAEDEQAELYGVTLETGDVHLLASSSPPWGAPVWSPDGHSLAWPAGEGLLIIDAADGTRLQSYMTALPDMARPAPVWSEDGLNLYYPRLIDGALALWALPATTSVRAGDAQAVLSLATASLWAATPAPGGGLTLWLPGEVLTLDGDQPAGAAPASFVLPEDIGAPVALAWSPDGEKLVLIDSAGGLWIGTPGDWPELPGFRAAGLFAARWTADDALLLWRSDATPRDQALIQLSLPDYAAAPLGTTPLANVGPLGLDEGDYPLAAVALDAQSAPRAYDWYRYQGEWDSGAMASSNCGPTAVAMAIQFARDNQWVRISDIRAYIGGSSWTYASSLRSALTHWSVSNAALHSMAEVDAALARGSIVLAHVWMYHLSPGADHMIALSNPAANTNRYHRYDQSHWLLLKGTSADGQWVVTHDPNVWDGNGVYWYSGNLAKGRDRLYRYTEMAAAIASYNYELIEVPAGGAAPGPTATPVATAPPAPTAGVPTAGVWHTVRAGENLYRISLQYGTTVAAIASANGLANPNIIYIGQRLWIPQSGAPTAVPPAPTDTPVSPSATPPAPTATSAPASTPTALAATATAVPAATTVPVATATLQAGTGVWHTVTWGDTLSGIATRYGVPVQAIAQANGIADPNLIRLGQRLWIPQGGAGVPPTATAIAGATATATATTGAPGAERWYVVQRGDTLSTIAWRYDIAWQSLAEANGLNAWSVIYPGQRLRIP